MKHRGVPSHGIARFNAACPLPRMACICLTRRHRQLSTCMFLFHIYRCNAPRPLRENACSFFLAPLLNQILHLYTCTPVFETTCRRSMLVCCFAATRCHLALSLSVYLIFLSDEMFKGVINELRDGGVQYVDPAPSSTSGSIPIQQQEPTRTPFIVPTADELRRGRI